LRTPAFEINGHHDPLEDSNRYSANCRLATQFIKQFQTPVLICPKSETPVCSRLQRGIKLTRDHTATAGEEHMKLSDWRNTRLRLALVYVLAICSFQLYPLVSHAQNLGQSPQTGQAVQGQTAAQPEGTVLNLVNWVGNVISPVGAALAVVMAVVSYSQGRGVARWAVTAAGLLVISGLTRLIEFWIQNGTAGVQ
jgi:hypothetical protein